MADTKLSIVPPITTGFNGTILQTNVGPMTGNWFNVANWNYFGLFFRLDHIGGTADILGAKVWLEGRTIGIISGGASVYGKAVVLEVRDFATWFSGPGRSNYVNYTNNDVIFQVNWSKSGSNNLALHGGSAEVVAARSWQEVRLIFQGFGAVGSASTLHAFLQGY